MLPPLNLGFAAEFARQLICAAPPERPIVSADLSNSVFKHLQVLGPFTLRFFAILPIGEIELTEYKLSKCVPLSRPTRVLSVIPVTGAPILHGKATTPTHHHSLDFHRKAPTPSPNQLTYRPPGQKTVLDEYIGFQLSDFGPVISFLQIMCVFAHGFLHAVPF